MQFKLGAVGELEMDLAEDMQVSEDGLSYTFTLRKGVKFHDGSELTADDVKYTVDRMLALKKGVYGSMSSISGAEVVDDSTVVITLASRFPALPQVLAKLYILNADLVKANETSGDWGEAYLVEHDAGTGPYQFVSWQREREFIMEKFPDYYKGWDGNHGDRLVWRVIKEPATAQLAMEQASWIGLAPSPRIPGLKWKKWRALLPRQTHPSNSGTSH